jgi:hypothetical protein
VLANKRKNVWEKEFLRKHRYNSYHTQKIMRNVTYYVYTLLFEICKNILYILQGYQPPASFKKSKVYYLTTLLKYENGKTCNSF